MKHRAVVLSLALLLTTAGNAQDGATGPVRESMTAIAAELLGTLERPGGVDGMLGIDRGEMFAHAFDDANRENWQFWPTARVGLPLEVMSAAQRMLVHDLLTTALSSQGYMKVVNIMQLEEILDVLDQGGLPRSVDHYVLALFGTPSADAPWGWRFEGHHVSLNVTVAPDGVSVTPSFLGSNPAEVTSGPLAGLRVHGIQEDLARELVGSLSAAQRARAVVSDTAPGEIFTGNIRKPREQWDAWIETLAPEGIAVADLNESQRFWVQRIVDEAVRNYRPEIAAATLDALDLDDLSFAWMGSTERRAPHYFRLQGPDFVYEYDNVQNAGNHVHAVWRSKSGDFGSDVLGRHYQTSAH